MVLFLLSCDNGSKEDDNSHYTATVQAIRHEQNDTVQVIHHKNKVAIKSIEELNSNTNELGFYGGGVFDVGFQKNAVDFSFTPSCSYIYPTEILNDSLILKWSFNENCTFNIGIKKQFRTKKHPIINKPFAAIYKMNDSTLRVNYYYESWMDSLNKKASNVIDTLFPRILHLKRR